MSGCTLYRAVDALGGTGLPSEGESWSRGYSEALSDVLTILADRGFNEQTDPPLIAAAPDLYEALNHLADAAEKARKTDGGWDFAVTLPLARAALARARGDDA